jgi:hypothetical protein
MCTFKLLFGIPCFTCGITRSIISFLNLDFKEAFIFHPLLLIIIAYIIFGILDVLKIRNISKSEIYLLFSLLVFIYFVRMYLYFPHIPPMDYEENNLINFILYTINQY